MIIFTITSESIHLKISTCSIFLNFARAFYDLESETIDSSLIYCTLIFP